MTAAAKWFDPVVGMDIHLVTLPNGIQAPLPHPFFGVVFDPIGAALGAALGALAGGGGAVFVQGLPAANTGTDVKGAGHFPTPPGLPPKNTDAPSNTGTLVTGSKTVKFGGASQSRSGSMVSSCGFPISLPTSVCLAVPQGAPVNIGGPEAVDVGAAVMAGIRTKWASKKLYKLTKATQGGWRSKVICFLTGHPIDVMTGQLLSDAIDFEVAGLIPIVWERNYRSRSTEAGALGPGWWHPFDEWVDDIGDDNLHVQLPDGRDKKHHVSGSEVAVNVEDHYKLRRRRGGIERVDYESGLTYFYRALPDGRYVECHQLMSIENRAGAVIQFRYALGELSHIIDTAGRQLDLAWQDERLTSVSHLGKLLVSYDYADGQLVKATDPLGQSMKYAYRGGVMVKEQHKGGLTFHFRWTWYHPEGWCYRTWGEQPNGEGGKGNTGDNDNDNGNRNSSTKLYPRRLRYDKQRRITSVKDARGSWTYYGNPMGLVDRQVDAGGGKTTFVWNSDCRKVAEVDGLGHTTRWAYDRWGQCIATHDPLGRATRRSYTGQHQLHELVDPSGEKWRLYYGLAGQPIALTDPLGHSSHYGYDQHGRLTTVEDPAGRTVRFGYHANHTLAAVTDGEGRRALYRADALGRMVWQQDAAGRTTSIVRDAAGQPTHMRHGDGDEQWLRYDADGNLAERVDGLGRRERMRYVGTGQLAEYIDAAGLSVKLRYDAEENITHVFNQAGACYFYRRDNMGRVKTEIGYDSKRTFHVYDAIGQRTITMGPIDGHNTHYRYDEAGQLRHLTTTDRNMNVQYEWLDYDPCGRLIGATRRITAKMPLRAPEYYSDTPDVTIRLKRDAAGRIIREEQQTGDGPTFAITSCYDAAGLRIQRDSSMGQRVDYEHNRAGELNRVRVGLVPRLAALPLLTKLREPWHMTITHNPAGEEIARAFPGGIRSLTKRDGHGRLAERHVLTGVNAAKYQAGRDLMRHVYQWRSATELASQTNLLSGWQAHYTHDQRGALVSASHYPAYGSRKPPAIQRRLSDAVGNLYQRADMSDAAYLRGGQLVRWGGNTYQYDGANRLECKTLADGGQFRYRYSPQGQLHSVTRPDGKVVRFDYDVLGRRTQKRFEGAVTTYVWDGDQLAHMQRREADGRLLPLVSWANEPGAFTPLVQVVGGERYGVVADQVGAVVMLTDEAGEAGWQGVLDIYGKVIEERGEVLQWLRYPGQIYDEESGLYYNRHRYYDAEAGRYITEDPLGIAGGLALYGYVADPLGWVDPWGLSGCDATGRKRKGAFFKAVIGNDDVLRIVSGPMSYNKAMSVMRGLARRTLAKDKTSIWEGVYTFAARDARQLARKVGKGLAGGCAIKDVPHPNKVTGLKAGRYPHFHPPGRPGGHVWFGGPHK